MNICSDIKDICTKIRENVHKESAKPFHIQFEIQGPHHGLNTEGPIEGANSGLHGKETNSRSQRGKELA